MRNKARKWVLEALVEVSAGFPFPIVGIDSDNGGEFIDHHLLAYCQDHEITCTRSRPHNSNDGCHVTNSSASHDRIVPTLLCTARNITTDLPQAAVDQRW